MGERKGHPFRGNQYTTYGTTRFGPSALPLKAAKKAGYTEGPYYHSTDAANKILKRGLRSSGYAPWEVRDPGTSEDFPKWGKGGHPVFVGTSKAQVAGYGKRILTVYAKPGSLKSAAGKTLAGGLFTVKPSNLIPIAKKMTHRMQRAAKKK